MDKKTLDNLSEEVQTLFQKIDKHIGSLVSARINHDKDKEIKSSFEAETLLVQCEQTLACISDMLNECHIIPKKYEEKIYNNGGKQSIANVFCMSVYPEDYHLREYVYVKNEDYFNTHIDENVVIERYVADNAKEDLKRKIASMVMNGDISVECVDTDTYETSEENITYLNTEEFI